MTTQSTASWFGLVALTANLVTTQTYTVTPIGVPGGRPQAISETGFIVGWHASGGGTRAFVHDPVAGTHTDIGVLPGMSFALARDINLLGEVVGSSWPAAISQPGRAFRYTPGVGMTDLGLLNGPTSQAYCVDDLGNVGGSADASAFLPEAFYQVAGSSMQSELPRMRLGRQQSATSARPGFSPWSRHPARAAQLSCPERATDERAGPLSPRCNIEHHGPTLAHPDRDTHHTRRTSGRLHDQ